MDLTLLSLEVDWQASPPALAPDGPLCWTWTTRTCQWRLSGEVSLLRFPQHLGLPAARRDYAPFRPWPLADNGTNPGDKRI